jgi:hypothetical protein
MPRNLFPRAALGVFQFRLTPFGGFALRLGDDEGAATHVYGFIEVIVCHVDFSLAYV